MNRMPAANSTGRKWIDALLQAMCLFILAACSRSPPEQVGGGNVERGNAAIEHYSCVACHVIPGIPKPGGNVGPSLDKIAKRAYIAGILANTSANMERWLRNPPAVDSLTAMPNLGITEAEAKDITAYLYTLD